MPSKVQKGERRRQRNYISKCLCFASLGQRVHFEPVLKSLSDFFFCESHFVKVKVTDTTWLLWTILSFGNVGCTLAAAYCYSPPSGIPTLLRLMATANVPSRPKTIIVVKLVVYTTEKSPFFSSDDPATRRSQM